ncbi:MULTISPECIES: large conductance mechanosensitive channel protein MscL [unclassified Prochlorococcus]|uniref:large conductance mechanosensitive channel protein MscL n=1 Tax=unclassified Prochlorococcus TaxID=2627481 RepID=UPI0005337D43|nr:MULTISPECIES: large conductance mechanosensitive channel protein MscL [unclassified Prochlorococcus]KGG27440.1 Large-conductance mechanosensitive channel [Prochlorococcus sp. MIT 0702]KGG27705.1 Large-conductance mechanosensitive channel [Prochlorococcus sp. MIT 0701]KGG31943.1 Large-conductance mechanosensitive channel [Prochlorococcus sp. MIT 0703]
MAYRRKITNVLNDFTEFVNRGNVVDLAVAVVVGGAFSKLVDALVKLVTGALMDPLLHRLQVDTLSALPGGALLVSMINFLVIAFVVFIVVRALERFKRKEEAKAAAAPPPQQDLADAVERLAIALESRKL